MKDKILLSALVVLTLTCTSSAQLSGSYTIDPSGSGPKNYTTFSLATAAILGGGVSGPVVFNVASTTFKEAVNVYPATGMSATNTVTFVATGTPAVIDANGAQMGLTLNGACSYYVFDNLEVKNFTQYGLNLTGPSSTKATFCTFRKCKIDAPQTTTTSIRAVHAYYSNDCTFEDCVFAGGGYVFYTQQINRCFLRRCEFDGKGRASQILSLWNSNDSDNLYENCFFHDCGPSGYALWVQYSQYGIMFWHNTVIVNTSGCGVNLGSCCAWTRANSFRNNIVVNMGTGGCIRYGFRSPQLEYNDLDYNCYFAPNGKVCELENGTTFTKGTLADWLKYFNANQSTLVPAGGGTSWDQNSMEADPGLMSMTAPYDIHLKGSSPCLDSGTTNYVVGAWVSYNPNYKVADDFEGHARPATLVDIGADEVVITITGSGSGQPGTTITLFLSAPSDGGLPYVVGSSLGSGPIPIDTRLLNLGLDALLDASVNGYLPTVFQDYAGTLDASGKATAKLNIPNLPGIKGIRIHSAFLTLKQGAPSNIQSISNSFIFTIM